MCKIRLQITIVLKIYSGDAVVEAVGSQVTWPK